MQQKHRESAQEARSRAKAVRYVYMPDAPAVRLVETTGSIYVNLAAWPQTEPERGMRVC